MGNVLEMSHDECTKLIKSAGNTLDLKVERGDHIVPNIHEAFPIKKDESDNQKDSNSKDRPYWIQSLEAGQGMKSSQHKGFTMSVDPRWLRNSSTHPWKCIQRK